MPQHGPQDLRRLSRPLPWIQAMKADVVQLARRMAMIARRR